MTKESFKVAVIKGDGIGVDVTDAALAVVDAAARAVGAGRAAMADVQAWPLPDLANGPRSQSS